MLNCPESGYRRAPPHPPSAPSPRKRGEGKNKSLLPVSLLALRSHPSPLPSQIPRHANSHSRAARRHGDTIPLGRQESGKGVRKPYGRRRSLTTPEAQLGQGLPALQRRLLGTVAGRQLCREQVRTARHRRQRLDLGRRLLARQLHARPIRQPRVDESRLRGTRDPRRIVGQFAGSVTFCLPLGGSVSDAQCKSRNARGAGFVSGAGLRAKG